MVPLFIASGDIILVHRREEVFGQGIDPTVQPGPLRSIRPACRGYGPNGLPLFTRLKPSAHMPIQRSFQRVDQSRFHVAGDVQAEDLLC
jgi:hypothetical protein